MPGFLPRLRHFELGGSSWHATAITLSARCSAERGAFSDALDRRLARPEDECNPFSSPSAAGHHSTHHDLLSQRSPADAFSEKVHRGTAGGLIPDRAVFHLAL